MSEERPNLLPVSRADINEVVESFSASLGRVAITWNLLHEALAKLFAGLVTPDGDPTAALAAWHSQVSDRSQRMMLRAVGRTLRPYFKLPVSPDKSERLFDDIDWLLGKVDSFSEDRNSAIHLPVDLLFRDTPRIAPSQSEGNRHALRLKDADLVELFDRITDQSVSLSGFTRELTWRLGPKAANDGTWPERPTFTWSFVRHIKRDLAAAPPGRPRSEG